MCHCSVSSGGGKTSSGATGGSSASADLCADAERSCATALLSSGKARRPPSRVHSSLIRHPCSSAFIRGFAFARRAQKHSPSDRGQQTATRRGVHVEFTSISGDRRERSRRLAERLPHHGHDRVKALGVVNRDLAQHLAIDEDVRHTSPLANPRSGCRAPHADDKRGIHRRGTRACGPRRSRRA